MVDVQDGGNGGEEHDDSDYTRSQQGDGLATQAETLEDERRVVQNEVDTGPLLERHDKNRHSRALEVSSVGQQASISSQSELDAGRERVVLVLREVALGDPFLEDALGLDFKVLHFDQRSVDGKTAEVRDDLSALFFSSLIHKPTWGLGHEHDTEGKNEGRDELDSDRDEPRSLALAIASSADEVGACES